MGKDLLDRFTINFREFLDDDGLMRVFSKLSKEKDFRISWNIGINYLEDPRREIASERKLQKGVGTITSTNIKQQGFVALPFYIKIKESDDEARYTSIQFQMIPDYEEQDYNSEDLKAWDDLREYFKSNYPFVK